MLFPPALPALGRVTHPFILAGPAGLATVPARSSHESTRMWWKILGGGPRWEEGWGRRFSRGWLQEEQRGGMSQRACHGCDKGELIFQTAWIRNVYKGLENNLQGESTPYKESRNWWHRNNLLKNWTEFSLILPFLVRTSVYRLATTEKTISLGKYKSMTKTAWILKHFKHVVGITYTLYFIHL